eukprot:gene24941-30136_t
MSLQLLLVCIISTCGLIVVQADVDFVLPKTFEGLWKGQASRNIIGPLDSFEFAISRSPNGDYLFEDNLLYDNVMIGYQRFYVEGTGSTAGTLWYCGALSNFSNSVEQTGTNAFKPLVFPLPTDSSVTFCLDSDNPDTMGFYNPFRKGCTACECSNWTITHNPADDSLALQVMMSGQELGSYHLWADLTRIGPAPVISDADMPGHGSNFSCEFTAPGRDSVPVVFPNTTKNDRLAPNKPPQRESQASLGSGCPFMKKRLMAGQEASSNGSNSNGHMTKSSYDHCYVLNSVVGLRLSWTLDTENELLRCSVAAPVPDINAANSTYVAVGFRPLSRSMNPTLSDKGTGHHMNFGMQGADIVAGSVGGGVRVLYAEEYTGAPVPSDALKISEAAVQFSDGFVTMSFTRPLVGGYMHTQYGSDASIVSGDCDILWAVGSDVTAGNEVQLDYHFNQRGLRVVDWVSPEIAMAEAWKC